MKNIGNYYFPLEISVIDDPRVERMIDEMGAGALGIYIGIMIELRRRFGHKCQLNSLYKLKNRLNSTKFKIRKVITDYDLFNFSGAEGDEAIVSSKYLNKVMEPLDARKERRRRRRLGEEEVYGEERKIETPISESDAHLHNNNAYNKSNRESNRENNRENKNDDVVVLKKNDIDDDDDVQIHALGYTAGNKPWQQHVREAMNDESWSEVMAMKSHLPFDTHKELIFELFMQHVVCQGSEYRIGSDYDAKAYFANFSREGTTTHKRLLADIREQQQREWEKDPYRFEQVDQQTGARSYYGMPIPADAPPRPDRASFWNEHTGCWVGKVYD